MKEVYVSILYSGSFLPGILVLNHSLKKTGASRQFLLLVTPNLTDDIVDFLISIGITIKRVDMIANPGSVLQHQRFEGMYTKLQAFSLTEYSKVVYLDADMLVCSNLDSLFTKKHMAAVNAGGNLPENRDWVDLNAGLLVIEPRAGLFEDILAKIPFLYSKDGGDQGFLHSYYPNWKHDPDLHLDHGYNMYPGFLERYCALFKYDFVRDIKVLHFWGSVKPWMPFNTERLTSMHRFALDLWKTNLNECVESLDSRQAYFIKQECS